MTDWYSFAIEVDPGGLSRPVKPGGHVCMTIESTAYVCFHNWIDGKMVEIEPRPEYDPAELAAAREWAAGMLARLYLAVYPEIEYMGQLHKCDRSRWYGRRQEGDWAGEIWVDYPDESCTIEADLRPDYRNGSLSLTCWVPPKRTERTTALLARELGKLLGAEGGEVEPGGLPQPGGLPAANDDHALAVQVDGPADGGAATGGDVGHGALPDKACGEQTFDDTRPVRELDLSAFLEAAGA